MDSTHASDTSPPAEALAFAVTSVELPSYRCENPYQAVAKFDFISTPASEADDGSPGFGGMGGRELKPPPINYASLARICERSNAIRPNLDAYATNIDGFGYRIEATMDLEADDIAEQIADTIRLEAYYEEGWELSDAMALEPASSEIERRKKIITRRIRFETGLLRAFLEGCVYEDTFTSLRKQTRVDKEGLGHAAWEVMRNANDEIVRFVRVTPHHLRLSGLLPRVRVDQPRRISPARIIRRPELHSFRLYALEHPAKGLIYFKSFGDPRAWSRQGKLFESLEAMEAAGQQPATELIYFRVYSPRTPYGLPRWLGVLQEVLGSEMAARVNRDYFEHKSVPPLALMISGHKGMTPEEVAALEKRIAEQVQGVDSFHSILILQAPASSTNTKPAKMVLESLTKSQQDDALFQNYDERNIDKVGMFFRLPRLIRGESKDFNRATAEATLRFAEDQVFQPERDEFDEWMNEVILPELGLECIRFQTQTLQIRDPQRMAEMVGDLVQKGVLTPGEARELASDVLNRGLRKITEPWVNTPANFTLAGIQNGLIRPNGKPIPVAPDPDAPTPSIDTNDLEALTAFVTKTLEEAEADVWGERVEVLRASLAASGVAVVDLGEDGDV